MTLLSRSQQSLNRLPRPVKRRALAEATSIIDLLDSWGVAVFTAPRGEKGTRTKGWPGTPSAEATRRSRLEAANALGEINLAARSGPTATGDCLAVVDLDGDHGVDAEGALSHLLALLPEGVAVVRTARGFTLWMRATRSVGDGPLPAYGGEVFSGGHLAQLPPSRHPDGVDYAWTIAPGGELPVVDLAALGLVPQAPPVPRKANGSGRRDPAIPEDRLAFEELMARAGVHPRRGRAELLRCPWHEDHRDSLSVNWESCVFNCFGCGARGGIGALRDLIGDRSQIRDTPTYYQGSGARPTGNKSGCSSVRLDVEGAHRRLSEALAGVEKTVSVGALPSTPSTSWSDAVLGCRERWRPGKCVDSGVMVASPRSCGFPLCPVCSPGRLAADWKRHVRKMPVSMTTFRLAPRSASGEIKRVGRRFAEWRKRAGLDFGVSGVRVLVRDGYAAEVILAVPDEEADKVVSSRAFGVEQVASGQSLEDVQSWWQAAYMEEATSWRTSAELVALVVATKGRRRFQGFGGCYRRSADGETPQAEPLGKVSGGAASASRRQAQPCPHCGGPVEWYVFTVPREEVVAVGDYHVWKGPQR